MEANAAVNRVQHAKAKETKKRGAYIKFDEKTKIQIEKLLERERGERGSKAELGRNINPSTVRGFKRAYLQELNGNEEPRKMISSSPAYLPRSVVALYC